MQEGSEGLEVKTDRVGPAMLAWRPGGPGQLVLSET